jgi:hypothetical protein
MTPSTSTLARSPPAWNSQTALLDQVDIAVGHAQDDANVRITLHAAAAVSLLGITLGTL